jgi:peroxiredoxin
MQVVDTPILTLDCDADMTLHPEMKDQLREQVSHTRIPISAFPSILETVGATQVRAFIAKLRASDTTEA